MTPQEDPVVRPLGRHIRILQVELFFDLGALILFAVPTILLVKTLP